MLSHANFRYCSSEIIANSNIIDNSTVIEGPITGPRLNPVNTPSTNMISKFINNSSSLILLYSTLSNTFNPRIITIDTILSINDEIVLLDATSSNLIITLPNNEYHNQKYTIVRLDNSLNTITINTSSSSITNISGIIASPILTATPGIRSTTLIFNGINSMWYEISQTIA